MRIHCAVIYLAAWLIVSSVAHGATFDRYVNTASTAGGDCTTSATSGASRACATLAEAMTAIVGLGTSGDTINIYCAGGRDTSRPTVAGVAGTTINIIATDKHDGTAGTGYRLIPNTNGDTLTINHGNVSLQGLEISNNPLAGTYSLYGNSIIEVSFDGAVLEVDSCLIYQDTTAVVTSGLDAYAIDFTLTFKNSIMYGLTEMGIALRPEGWGKDQTATIIHSLIDNIGDTSGETKDHGNIVSSRVVSETVSVTIYNSIITRQNEAGSTLLNTRFGGSSGDFTGDYNYADDSSVPGAKTVTTATITDNTAPGAGDWIIVTDLTPTKEIYTTVDDSDNDVLDAGDAGNSLSVDILGTSRASPPDIGPFEVGASAPIVTPERMKMGIGL